MQPASEKCSYLEQLSCREGSLKGNQFCFNQNQNKTLKYFLVKSVNKYRLWAFFVFKEYMHFNTLDTYSIL